MRFQNVSGMLIKQAMSLPVFIIIPILFGFFANDYNSITQHMSEMTMDSRIANFIDKGSTVAAGVSVCLFGVGCLWWGGALRWSFTMLVAVAGGMGMASNGVFEAGSPLHGLYGLPIFLVFVPAFFIAEFSVPTVAPANDLQIGKVGLPHLIDGSRLILELASGFYHNDVRAGNQVMRLEQPVHASF